MNHSRRKCKFILHLCLLLCIFVWCRDDAIKSTRGPSSNLAIGTRYFYHFDHWSDNLLVFTFDIEGDLLLVGFLPPSQSKSIMNGWAMQWFSQRWSQSKSTLISFAFRIEIASPESHSKYLDPQSTPSANGSFLRLLLSDGCSDRTDVQIFLRNVLTEWRSTEFFAPFTVDVDCEWLWFPSMFPASHSTSNVNDSECLLCWFQHWRHRLYSQQSLLIKMAIIF